jgi:6-phosphogluconate dehydrogenase
MSAGVIGLGTLGSRLALKIKKHHDVCVHSENRETLYNFVQNNPNISGFTNMDKMLSHMERPRVVFTAFPNGIEARDAVITLARRLGPIDVVIDCSNEHYENSKFRCDYCNSNSTQYLGLGISRDCVMIGGSKKVYIENKNLIHKLADNVVYMGQEPDDGHFTNMIHNGVEYSILQGMADVFSYCNNDQDIMKLVLEKSKGSDINGYITNYCFDIVNMLDLYGICDVPEIKSTGLRCSEISLRNNIPIPTMNAALNTRCSNRFLKATHTVNTFNDYIDVDLALGALRFIYSMSMIEGLVLMGTRNIDRNLVIKAWSKGTRIECSLLERDPFIASNESVIFAREFVLKCIQSGIPCPVVQAALTHYDFIHQHKNSLSLITAYFENPSLDVV